MCRKWRAPPTAIFLPRANDTHILQVHQSSANKFSFNFVRFYLIFGQLCQNLTTFIAYLIHFMKDVCVAKTTQNNQKQKITKLRHDIKFNGQILLSQQNLWTLWWRERKFGRVPKRSSSMNIVKCTSRHTTSFAIKPDLLIFRRPNPPVVWTFLETWRFSDESDRKTYDKFVLK